MAKDKVLYICNACGAAHPKWVGQCQDCGAWNTLQEEVTPGKDSASTRFAGFAPREGIQRLDNVALAESDRHASGIGELDRVLGGGLVSGSVILLGGDPGIGKSTLLLQAMGVIGVAMRSLYVSGEESAQQIAMRAQRLGVAAGEMHLLSDNCLESLLDAVQSHRPEVLVVDSIQTLYTEQLQSAPGSVAQVRETAARLVRYAKQTHTIVILVGHVTKEGNIAGPRVLEHMVDTVLYFEGDRNSSFRVIRAIKNRFGAVNELGVFAMTDRGLKEVSNPSAMFIKRDQDAASGSVILVSRDGARPLLVEVQALVDQTPLSNPRRVTVGLEQQRLAMLLAVLHRHAGYSLFDQDVFVNVVGGVKVHEPAADLAVLLAVLSSYRNLPIAADLAVFGEVGLTGELRPVQGGIERVREAEKLGFKRLIMPRANRAGVKSDQVVLNMVTTLEQAIETAFNGSD